MEPTLCNMRLSLPYMRISLPLFLVLPIALAFAKTSSQEPVAGKHFRIIVLEAPPHIILEDNNVISGLAVRYITKLSQSLNFTYTLLMPGNHTFGSVIKHLTECPDENRSTEACDFDMGGAGFTKSPQRRKVVDFVDSYVEGQFMQIITRLDNTATRNDPFFFLKPFNRWLWASLGGLIVYASILYWIDGYVSPRVRGTRSMVDTGRRGVDAAFSALVGIMGHGRDSDNTSTPAKLIFITILMVSLIFITLYEAVLINILSVLKQNELELDGIDDFIECRRNITRVAVARNTAVMDYWNHTVMASDCVKKSGQTPIPCGAGGDCYSLVASKDADYSLAPSSSVFYQTNNKYCGVLTEVGEKVFSFELGFVLPKDSPYTTELSVKTLELGISGQLERSDAVIRECNPREVGGIVSARDVRAVVVSAYVCLTLILFGLLARWQASRILCGRSLRASLFESLTGGMSKTIRGGDIFRMTQASPLDRPPRHHSPSIPPQSADAEASG